MRWAVVVAALSVTVCGCATNKELVTRHAADSTGCNEQAIEVTQLDQLYAGIEHYETSGCGIKHRYRCPKWDNLLTAAAGYIYIDQRRCMQVKR